MYSSTSCINFLNLSLLPSKVSGLFKLISLGADVVVAMSDSGRLKSSSAEKKFSMGETGCAGRGSVKYSEDTKGLSSDSVSCSEWGVSSTDRSGLGFSSNPVGSKVLGFSSALS